MRIRQKPNTARPPGLYARSPGRRLLLVCVLALLFFPLRPIPAAGQVPMLRARSDARAAALGEPFVYTIEARSPEGWTPDWDTLVVDTGSFEVVDTQPEENLETGDGDAALIRLTLAGFETGEQKIPPAKLTFKGPDGKTVTEESNSVRLKVESTAPEEASELRDVKGPVGAFISWSRYLLIALGALAVLISLFFLARWALRRKRGLSEGEEEKIPSIPPRPPHEVALEALLELERQNLLGQGKIKPYYFRLSEIVREFIGGRYGFGAPEMTTTEIEETLEARQVERYLAEFTVKYLSLCDLVKFAKYRPPEVENLGMMSRARKLVNTARENNEPQPPINGNGAAVQSARNGGARL